MVKHITVQYSSCHVQGDLEATEWVDVAIATHYFDRPQSSLVAMEKPSAFTKQMAFSKH